MTTYFDIHTPIMFNDAKRLRELLADSPLVGPAPGSELTPLFLAAWFGQVDAAKVLLEHGVNVNEKSVHGGSPLDVAELFDHQAMIELLRAKGGQRLAQLRVEDFADIVCDEPEATRFLAACATGNTARVKEMLQQRPGLVEAASTERQETGLHAAAAQGKEAVVDILLAAGADPTAEAVYDETPALLAWQHGRNALEDRLRKAEDSYGS